MAELDGALLVERRCGSCARISAMRGVAERDGLGVVSSGIACHPTSLPSTPEHRNGATYERV